MGSIWIHVWPAWSGFVSDSFLGLTAAGPEGVDGMLDGRSMVQNKEGALDLCAAETRGRGCWGGEWRGTERTLSVQPHAGLS